jgi:hypothetical protein
MQIAKPPGGFVIDEPSGVKAAIAAHAKRWPRIGRYWADIRLRLSQTGHREGEPIKGPPGARLYVAEGHTASGLPTIKVAYSVLGDTLRIRAVMVEPADSAPLA